MNLVNYYGNEVKYRVKRTGHKIQGGVAAGLVKLGLGGGAATVATSLSSGAPVILSTGAGMLGIGAGAGFDIYLNEMEHRHKEFQLLERFEDEISSITGKPKESLGVQDLKAVARDNSVLEKEIERSRKIRNIKSGAAIAGSLAAFGIVFAAVALIPAVGALAATAAAGGLAATAVMAVGSLAVSVLTLGFTRKKVVDIAREKMHLNEPTPMDHIKGLSKQLKQYDSVTPSQVMGVFAASRPDLNGQISAAYGDEYQHLNTTQQREATETFGKSFGINSIADLLNEGRMRVQELTFTTQGQSSGFIPPPPLTERIQEKYENVKENVAEKVQDWKQDRASHKLEDDITKAVLENKQLPEEALKIAPEQTWRELVIAKRQQEAGKGTVILPARR